MAETVKSFIDKLQADGVRAGQQAAEEIRARAEQQAKQRIDQAEAQARQIIADAQAECENLRARTRTELDLAARDTLVRLHEALGRALQRVLSGAAAEQLSDTNFLGELLREIVMQYVRADAEHVGTITINVPDEMRHKLVDWAIQVLHKDLERGTTGVDLKGTLSEAGFEYTVSGGTVEVTVSSVVQVLSDLVGPDVRKMLVEAVEDK